MYASITKHNFYSISEAVDRVSDAVYSDLDKVDTNNIKLTYDNASVTNVITDNFHHLLMKIHIYVRTHFYTPNDKN